MLHSKPVYDPPTLAVLRCALDEVLTDHRFLKSTSTSALEIAEFILAQAATGERDLERLKSSALKNSLLSCRTNGRPERINRSCFAIAPENCSKPSSDLSTERR